VGRILGDHRVRCLKPEESLAHLEQHLVGIELDPFAAWMTRVFLRLQTRTISRLAGRFLEIPILERDALEEVIDARSELGRFDLVVGNPPYGRVSLHPERRRAFGRSLYGHANVYGLFLDAALHWRKPSGLIAFVTPTSFLGGKYFSRLRNLLLEEAPPLVIDVLEARTGVFDLVQQETCLAIFGPNPSRSTVVHHLRIADRRVRASRAGTFELSTAAGSPWLLPRTARQATLAERAFRMRTRLHHLGYRAATGPLVWNRHKEQLRTHEGADTFPLIWAEAVRPNRFAFEYRSRAHSPFFALREDQEHLLDCGPCVLVQRTTAKEQKRRLVACAVPPELFERWGQRVIENHVNVLRAIGAKHVAPAVLAAVLNTETVDQVFRCLSGTVAVSATELHALPLPPRSVFSKVACILRAGNGRLFETDTATAIEEVVAEAYGVEAP
jgi:adenine-specific DNA-methyltransferase